MLFKNWLQESEELLRVCGWCRRQIGADNAPVGAELYPEMNPLRLSAYAKSIGLPTMTHGICSECYTKMTQEQ